MMNSEARKRLEERRAQAAAEACDRDGTSASELDDALGQAWSDDDAWLLREGGL